MSAPMVRAILAGTKTQTRRAIKPQPVPFGKSSYGGTRQGWKWKPESLNRGWNDDDADPYNTRSLATLALSCECPYGQPGDRLWARETFYQSGRHYQTYPEDDEWRGWSGTRDIFYKADGIPPNRGPNAWSTETNEENAARLSKHGRAPFFTDKGNFWWRQFPSIFMPRWASRITLEIESVRVERLQEISEGDAIGEGLQGEWSNDGGETPGRRVYFTDVDDEGTAHGDPREAYRALWESINGTGSWALNPWVWVVTFKAAQPAKNLEGAENE
jgi:hypothetical protein